MEAGWEPRVAITEERCFSYSPQAAIDTFKTVYGIAGQPIVFKTYVDRTTRTFKPLSVV